MYRTIVKILQRFFKAHHIFKYGFNWSPMYRRTTAKLIKVSEDLKFITIKIPITWKNRNYAGSIFGGSLFAATDPIYMIQLIQILGDDYVVWDKAATIKYKRPAKTTVYGNFMFSEEEIESIKQKVIDKKETEILKQMLLKSDDVIYAEISKTIYIAEKAYYKKKLKRREKA